MPELDFKSAIETNWIKLGTLEMEATGDRVIVVQDEFRSGMECVVCRGKNIRPLEGGEAGKTVSAVECQECHGKGSITKDREGLEPLIVRCNWCKGKGWVPCPACEGKGGIVVFAQQDEKSPTTGTIVSVGEKIFCARCEGVGFVMEPISKSEMHKQTCTWCNGTGGSKKYRRGEAIIYPSFAGHFWELEAVDVYGNDVHVVVGVLREDEIITRVRGHLELRRVKKSVALHTAA
jgi:hypothetical protein